MSGFWALTSSATCFQAAISASVPAHICQVRVTGSARAGAADSDTAAAATVRMVVSVFMAFVLLLRRPPSAGRPLDGLAQPSFRNSSTTGTVTSGRRTGSSRVRVPAVSGTWVLPPSAGLVASSRFTSLASCSSWA